MRRRAEATQPADDASPDVFLPLPHLHFHVLLALADGPLHGWEIIKRIRAISDGRESPSTGSLYLAMNRLLERELLEDAQAPSGADSRRRYAQLTARGRRVLAAETARLATLVRVSEQRLASHGTEE